MDHAPLHLPPEVRLLLACAQRPAGPPHQRAIDELSRLPLDWAYFLKLVWIHEVHPLVALNLEAWGGAGCPAEVAAALRTRQAGIARDNLRLTAELLRILGHFARHGVEAIPFKGPALAGAAYGDVGLRENGDLDLLLKKEDIETAEGLLAGLGYAFKDDVSPDLRARIRTLSYALPLVRRAGGATYLVELHWDLLPERTRWTEYDVAGVWERRTTVALGGHRVPALAPEDMLLLLCVHGSKHRWSALKWLVDLVQYASSRTIEWEAVLHRADQIGARRMLGLSFLLAERLLEYPVPAPIEPIARADRGLGVLVRQVSASLASVSAPSVRDTTLFRFRMGDRRLQRWRYLWDVAMRPTQAELNTLRLPALLAGLYWLYRPLRLAGFFLRRARKAIAGPASAR